VTTKPWIVVHEHWERKPQGIDSLVAGMWGYHGQYSGARSKAGNFSRAYTIYDETSMGGAIIKQHLHGLTPLKGINFGGTSQVKLNLLTNLRAALLSGLIRIPASMTGLKREILNYRLEDKHIQQDRVMALALCAWMAAKGFSGVYNARFDPGHRVEPVLWR
jgi:hypothetical protein